MELAIPSLVVVFALLDVTLAAFRAAAGRNGRIRKGAYFRRAMARGAAVGAALVLVLGGVTAAVLYAASDAVAVWRDLLAMGAHLAWWFGGFALVVLGSLGVYAVSRHEWRTLATTAVLGPFTLVRPFLVVGATASASTRSEGIAAIALSVLASASVLGVGAVLDWAYGRAPPITADEASE